MSKLPTVAECMDRYVDPLRPDMDILDAVDFLLDHRVTSAPVLDASGKLVGILSEKDCLKLLTVGADNEFPRGTVASFMATSLQVVNPKMDVYYAAGLFLKNQFRRFPVVDDDGHLVGAITRFDILRAVKSRLREAST